MADVSLEFYARIFGDRETIQALDGFPAVLRRHVRLAIGGAARDYQRELQSVELSGGMVKTVSGRMKGSIVVNQWDAKDGSAFGASIFPRGTKAPHAYYVGIGVTRKNETWVHEFQRRYKPGDRMAPQQGPVTARQAARSVTAGTRARPKLVSGTQTVKAHARKVRRAGIPYMGTAYARLAPRIEQRLRGATVQAVEEFNAMSSDFDGLGVG